MTPATFASYVRFKTQTNSTTFTDANMLLLMKVRQEAIAQDILKADEDILLIPQTANLVASTTTREYSFPSDMLSRIKRIEAAFDGTNFIKLGEIDITQYTGGHTETEITQKFANEEGRAKFDIRRNAIYIYSGTITAVTNGLKLWVNTWPAPVTDLSESSTDMSVDPSTTTHGIPRALHEIWARGVIIDYKSSKQKPIPLTESETNYDKDLQKAIETLKHGNLDREVIAQVPGNVNQGDMGDNGYDF